MKLNDILGRDLGLCYGHWGENDHRSNTKPIKPRHDNDATINNDSSSVPRCRTRLVGVGDGVSVALYQPVSRHFTNLAVAAGLRGQREELKCL